MSRPFALLAAALLSGVLGLSACTSPQLLNTLAPSDGYAAARNIVYDGAHGLRLDVYSPADTRKAPVVIYLHGGAWQQGRKEDSEYVGQALTSQGFVTVIPDYRLYPEARFPDFINDAAQAVHWAFENAARYGGDPHKLVVLGYDAGAYNAVMLALNPAYLKKAGLLRDDLRGVIGLAGAYDFLPITDPTLRVIFGPPEQFPQTQPVYWVDGANPPLLLVHGDDDAYISANNTRSLAQHLKNAGGTVETLMYGNLSHDMIVASLSSTWRTRADVLPNITDFIRRMTAGNPSAPAAGPTSTGPVPAEPGPGGPISGGPISGGPISGGSAPSNTWTPVPAAAPSRTGGQR